MQVSATGFEMFCETGKHKGEVSSGGERFFGKQQEMTGNPWLPVLGDC